MNEIVPFTDNYHDLSNEGGFQFEFVCERCGNGYRSPFQPDMIAKGRGLLRAVGSLTGGAVERLGWATDHLDRSTNSPAKDKALREAVDAVRPQFRQCRACGDWVCDEVCWNHEIGQCLTDAPMVVDELARAQAAAQVEQINERVREVNWTDELDLATRARVACPSGHAVDGGKFCPECGESLRPVGNECATCGSEVSPTAKFCPECGTPRS
ncbi:MAG: zinc ribbon domain-containing protein [Actinobacteria bacterium]|nr:zinc ribbon domain-containing protein [Actinomycetota bacterium]